MSHQTIKAMLLQLSYFERYIAMKWNTHNDVMRDCLMTARSRLLKRLLKAQLKEFDK